MTNALGCVLVIDCCVVLTFARRLATSRYCSLVGQQLGAHAQHDYSRFSRRVIEEKADSSNLKKGFGVTNFVVGCQLRFVKLACLVKEAPFSQNNHTFNNLKIFWQDSTLFPEYYSVLQFIFGPLRHRMSHRTLV